jgi:preprotein translocase subunit SecA
MLEKLLNALFGSQHERDIKALMPLLHKINALEASVAGLPPEAFPAKTAELKARAASGESLDSMLPEAFAFAREAARRAIGERPYDVQMMASVVLHQGKIVEMKTGEGKTLMCVAAAYLNALAGKGVHVITVNDYLAQRDAEWMRPIFAYLGMSVGVILSQMDNEARKIAYSADITYGTNNEFGFDYLRDNMLLDLESRVQRGHHYCIIDEIDSILIDEARTPLIISGSAEDDTQKFFEVNRLVGSLVEVEKKPDGEYPNEAEGEEVKGDYTLDEKSRRITFTDQGMNKIEELLTRRGLISGSLFSEENFEYIHYFTQAMRAHKLYHLDVDYVVQDGQVQIVDEFTGRVLHGRRYSDGLHQAIEAKEGIKVAQRNRTLATITFQNFFRMYDKISGMTGTADTEAIEFSKIYKLDVVVIPTNRPIIRKDEHDLVFLNEDAKFNAICDEIAAIHATGQPMLVGTVSIEKSEKLSAMLTRRGIRHEVLNAKNHAREALIIAEAGAKGSVTIATNMAGRGTDIKLGGNPEFRARRRAGTDASPEAYRKAYEEEYEKWKADYAEVRALGGLYILGTERHESRRIDNQLRGRAGRQGDPGFSRFFLSMDDDLMRLFGGGNMKGLMQRLGVKDDEPIFHPMMNRAIERAQKKVEERNFDIRKHLLEYDDVLNEQRRFIYEKRDEILRDERLKDRVMEAAHDVIADMLDEYREGLKGDFRRALASFKAQVKERFGIQIEADPEVEEERRPERLEEQCWRALDADLTEKISYAGERGLNQYLRFQYLQSIDHKWLDHLENLDALREAVYLRSYAQKNPLLEYKLEGFEIFDRLIADIRESIASRLFLVKVRPEDERKAGPRQVGRVHVASHGSVGGFGGAAPSQAAVRRSEPAASRPAQAQVVRAMPKVGRNEPCPCGSGKKYKMCHGR